MSNSNKISKNKEKDQILNPFILGISGIIIVAFLHLSFVNDLRAGSTGSNPFAQIEKFVIERVALF